MFVFQPNLTISNFWFEIFSYMWALHQQNRYYNQHNSNYFTEVKQKMLVFIGVCI